jgi:hypothetical protein
MVIGMKSVSGSYGILGYRKGTHHKRDVGYQEHIAVGYRSRHHL